MPKYTTPPDGGDPNDNGGGLSFTDVIAIILGIFGFVVLVAVITRLVSKKPFVPVWTTKRQAAAKQSKIDRELQDEIELRERQEAAEDRGERVWFSRFAEGGSLRHWVLFAYNKKYELRLDASRALHGTLAGAFAPSTSRYRAQITPFPDMPALLARRAERIAASKEPCVDGYYVCLIGWTRDSEQQLDAHFAAQGRAFGDYQILWNNCQHFLKGFSDAILPREADRAADYAWFRRNVDNRYDRLRRLPPIEEILRKQQLASMAATRVNINVQMMNANVAGFAAMNAANAC